MTLRTTLAAWLVAMIGATEEGAEPIPQWLRTAVDLSLSVSSPPTTGGNCVDVASELHCYTGFDGKSLPCLLSIATDTAVCATRTWTDSKTGDELQFGVCIPSEYCKVEKVKYEGGTMETTGCCTSNNCNSQPTKHKGFQCNQRGANGKSTKTYCGPNGNTCWSGLVKVNISGVAVRYGGCVPECKNGAYTGEGVEVTVDTCCTEDSCNDVGDDTKGLLKCNGVDADGYKETVVCPPGYPEGGAWEEPMCTDGIFTGEIDQRKFKGKVEVSGCIPKSTCSTGLTGNVTCCKTDLCNQVHCGGDRPWLTIGWIIAICLAVVAIIAAVAAVIVCRRRRSARAVASAEVSTALTAA